MIRSPGMDFGIGAVSSAGGNVAETLATFRSGARRFSSTFPFETSIACPCFLVKAELPVLPSRANASRSIRLAMAAIHEALGNAKIRINYNPDDAISPGGRSGGRETDASPSIDRLPPNTRVGVCMGTTVACQLNSLAFYANWRNRENPALDPVYDYLNANLGQAIQELFGVAGPRMTVVNACSSGTDAIGIAAGWIRNGLCDVAIAGGADEMFHVPVAGFWSLGVMSRDLCAPFDRDRSGLNLGEGAGVVVLESDRFARAMGRQHSCEVAGFGSACDAHHLTAPHPDGRGLDSAIRAALAQARISPGQVAFINAHGTATLDNDKTEGTVISRIFGQSTPFLSTKGYTGHTLGAAGGLEAAFTLLGLREGWIPASAGFANSAQDIPIMPVRAVTSITGEYALSTSLAFGGNNAAVILRRRA